MNKKKKTTVTGLIPQETIESKILLIRGKKVMLDKDLAELYDVETKQLKRAVNRNIGRFPEDFMFKLTKKEYHALRCQNGTLKRGAHSKYLPYAFMEHGVAMLSSVLNSERAIQVNIAIMRVFIRLKAITPAHKDVLSKIRALEKKIEQHEEDLNTIFDAN